MIPSSEPDVPKPETDLNQKRIKFRLAHFSSGERKKFKHLQNRHQRKICQKIVYWARRKLHEFKTGSAKPRKWDGVIPFAIPDQLSEDVKNELPDYFKIDNKIRVFGFMIGREFFVLGVTTEHRHSK